MEGDGTKEQQGSRKERKQTRLGEEVGGGGRRESWGRGEEGDTDGFPSPRLSHQTKAERRPRVMLPLLSNSSVEMKTGETAGGRKRRRKRRRWKIDGGLSVTRRQSTDPSRGIRTQKETGR